MRSEQLESFTEKKVGKLDKYFDAISKAEVYLKLEKSESKNNKKAEIKLFIPQHELFASKQADTFEEAVDLCADALKKQLGKHKEKK